MGHLHGRNAANNNGDRTLFRKLGQKIDGLQLRAPWNEQFYALTKALYSTAEADVVTKMPYTFSSAKRISRVTGYAPEPDI